MEDKRNIILKAQETIIVISRRKLYPKSSMPTSNNSTYTFNSTYKTNNLLFPLIQLYI
jgi:hypothetical protein